jgi:hypothetical protein
MLSHGSYRLLITGCSPWQTSDDAAAIGPASGSAGEFVKFTARATGHERRGTNWLGNHVTSVCPCIRRAIVMKKEIIRVEPLATHHEPETGEIFGDSFVMAICLAI